MDTLKLVTRNLKNGKENTKIPKHQEEEIQTGIQTISGGENTQEHKHLEKCSAITYFILLLIFRVRERDREK